MGFSRIAPAVSQTKPLTATASRPLWMIEQFDFAREEVAGANACGLLAKMLAVASVAGGDLDTGWGGHSIVQS